MEDVRSKNPGATTRPARSSTRASGGTVAVAPTASIRPFLITIVPFSIVPRVTVSILAFVSAHVPPCARARGATAATRMSGAIPRRVRLIRQLLTGVASIENVARAYDAGPGQASGP